MFKIITNNFIDINIHGFKIFTGLTEVDPVSPITSLDLWKLVNPVSFLTAIQSIDINPLKTYNPSDIFINFIDLDLQLVSPSYELINKLWQLYAKVDKALREINLNFFHTDFYRYRLVSSDEYVTKINLNSITNSTKKDFINLTIAYTITGDSNIHLTSLFLDLNLLEISEIDNGIFYADIDANQVIHLGTLIDIENYIILSADCYDYVEN